MLKKLVNLEIKSITAGAFVIALFSLVAKILGLLRDRILAGEFGAGDWLDIYYASFRIPDLVYNLIVLGAVSAGFIPVFSKVYASSRKGENGWKLVNNLITLGGIFLVIVSLVLIFFSDKLVYLIAPGFTAEKLEYTIAMSRIMFLSPILLGISSILSGVLQTFKRFFIFSLAPIMYNLGIIIGALFFVDIWGIYGLAWGVIFGAFLHMLIQLPQVFKLGFRFKPIIKITRDLKKIIGMMGPRSLSLVINQANLVVVTIIASGLVAGSLAIFNFANNLQFLPITLIGVSFAISAFPTLASAANKKDMEKFINSLVSVIRQIIFFIIPITVIFIVLRAQIVRVVLGTGLFDWDDTRFTIQTLGFFSLSLFAQCLIPVFMRAFFALHNTLVPFLCGFVAMFINVVLCFVFIKSVPMIGFSPVSGLALAFTISQICFFVLLWLNLKIKVKHLKEAKILVTVIKVSIASFVMGLYIWAGKYYIEPLVGTKTLIGLSLQTIFSLSVGLIVYIFLLIILRTHEFYVLIQSVTKRIKKELKPFYDMINGNS